MLVARMAIRPQHDPRPSPTAVVVAIYVMWGERVLYLKRATGKPFGDRFGVPAGKVDSGETPLEAASRELHEETGITLGDDQKLSPLPELHVDHRNSSFRYLPFFLTVERPPRITLRTHEHAAAVWLTIAEAKELPLVEDELESLTRLEAFLARR